MLKKSLVIVLTLVMVMGMSISAFAATTAINDWILVDSGKHCDWDGTTKYLKLFETSVSTWNGYKSEVFRKDSAAVIEDVHISDYREISGTLGVTSSS